MPLRVAICGDSAMWGQGLAREHTYAHLAATRIADAADEETELVPGRSPFEPLRGEARSGAKIRPKQDTDAEAFIDTYPLFFRSNDERLDLQFARDETPGSLLFGEHPATFPTITDAVRQLSESSGAEVDLVLLDGGINDIDFEEVLDPEGPELTKIVKELRRIFGDSLNQLLRETRAGFPRAVIVVVGYFSALSDRSDDDDLETLFKYLADKPEWQVVLNDRVQDVPIVREILNSFLTKDVPKLIRIAVRRSVAAAAQAHFWTRRTIAGLPSSLIGPGILYAHPGFRPEHALFAGSQTLLHDGYRPPGEGRHAVADEMLQTRLANTNIAQPGLGEHIPRLHLLATYRTISSKTTLVTLGADLSGISGDLESLLAEVDLPESVRSAARAIVDRQDRSKLEPLLRALSREIGRIEIATIASFIHPNEAGARRYADRIVTAYNDHQRFSIRQAVASMLEARQPGVHLGASTKQHGFDPSQGIRRLAAIARIESVAVQFEGLSSGIHPISLSLGGAKVDCTVTRSGSNRQFLAFDMALDLGSLTEVSLTPLLPRTPVGGGLPTFERLNLFLNAREFMSISSSDGRMDGQRLVLWTYQ